MKILIVDDAPANLKLLRAVLEGENYEVLEAPDGLQALAVLEHEEVSAIISDILMPRMDGYRLCREVRKSQEWRELPFIFYTATYTSPSDEKLCYDLGGDKYLRKPAKPEELLAALSEVMNVATRGPHNPAAFLSESEVMKEYSERLVSKLEQKNLELEKARTEMEQINRELDWRVQQRTAELKMANEELEAFAHSASHDLRAPLNHISGYLDIVLKNCAGQLDESNLKHLRTVLGAAERMRDLIDALLELSKVTRAEIHDEPVDLSGMAAEVVEELHQSDPNRVVQVEITRDLNAHGDPRLLRIALCNLLGNAWKYSRRRPDARIEFGKIPGGPTETYFVRDNGAGFDMTYVDKLFRPFQRLHGVYDFEGTGIGLATVERIIRRHHGSIRAESILHQGATFYFTLGNGDPK